MIDILRIPDDYKVLCDGENTDAKVRFELENRKLKVYLTAEETKPSYICMRWNHKATEPVKIMGDTWERSYGDLEWRSLNGEFFMPWYFMAYNGSETVGCGVMVQPNSFVSFTYDASGVTAWFDVRNGSRGVTLSGRELLAGIVVCERYSGISAFRAAQKFCKVMCPNPTLPKEPVYGSNNWYYAYGKSSYDEIMTDADIIAELAGQNKNKPYMVVDDGWQVNSGAGPWIPNDKYGDMKKVADGIKARGAKPGIWFRPLHNPDLEKEHPEWCLSTTYLDPTVPEVKKYIKGIVTTIKNWGYQLIKYDFSTVDIFGKCGVDLNGVICTQDLNFYETGKTTAEIVLDFYKLIREAAGDMVIIGCNTISHLCAGLVELNRIGDDTSGKVWSRTRAYGVNALAFRLCQNNAFYRVDADCVGVLDGNIPWKLNRQWLDVVARSGSPLFVSLQPESLTDEMKADIKEAMKINSVQTDDAEPLDWLYNNQPQKWNINGESCDYDFVMDSYPCLLASKTQPG